MLSGVMWCDVMCYECDVVCRCEEVLKRGNLCSHHFKLFKHTYIPFLTHLKVRCAEHVQVLCNTKIVCQRLLSVEIRSCELKRKVVPRQTAFHHQRVVSLYFVNQRRSPQHTHPTQTITRTHAHTDTDVLGHGDEFAPVALEDCPPLILAKGVLIDHPV